MDGYYDQHALLNLPRHLALAGPVATDNRRIGHRLSSLTGLPFLDLDRLLEHEAGQSLHALALREGADHYRSLERLCLDRALRDRPFGVLALGDGVLLDARNRRRLLDETTLVVLSRDLEDCFTRLQSLEPEGPKGYWHPFVLSELGSIDEVRMFYEERSPGYLGADHTIDVTTRGPKGALDELMRLITD